MAVQPTSQSRKVVFGGTRPRLESYEDPDDSYREEGPSHLPICIDDFVDDAGKYQVIHKVGCGGSAIVWLAHNIKARGLEPKYVAIKVLKGDTEAKEIPVLKHLRDQGEGRNPGVVSLLDEFTRKGPTGLNHQCLVLEYVGPCLRNITLYHKSDCEIQLLPFLKAASRNLAKSLALLHSAGVCHGDLTNTNVLFKIKDFQTWSIDRIHQHFGKPKLGKLTRTDNPRPEDWPKWAPKYLVETFNYYDFDIGLLSGEVVIADCGEAFFTSDGPPEFLGTPLDFRGPEIIPPRPDLYYTNYDQMFTSAVDLWALGCLIFEIHTFYPLIMSRGVRSMARNYIATTIGPPPTSWEWDFQMARGVKHFSERLVYYRPWILPEEASIVDLLNRLLAFDPESRISAAEVMDHPWFGSA